MTPGLRKLARGPWMISWYLMDRLVGPLYLKWLGVKFGEDLILRGIPFIRQTRPGQLILGDRVILLSRLNSNPLYSGSGCGFSLLNHDAEIRVGNDAAFSAAVLCAARSIHIGDRVLLGANVRILDTDFHPVLPEDRRKNRNAGAAVAPVVIDDDVFVGTGAIILKGVELGAGCLVAAGAVVTRSFPARSLIAGNPARVIRTLPN